MAKDKVSRAEAEETETLEAVLRADLGMVKAEDKAVVNTGKARAT